MRSPFSATYSCEYLPPGLKQILIERLVAIERRVDIRWQLGCFTEAWYTLDTTVSRLAQEYPSEREHVTAGALHRFGSPTPCIWIDMSSKADR